MPATPDAPARRPWWRAALLGLVLLVLAGVAWAYLAPPRPMGPAEPSPTPTPTHTIPEIARQQVWTSDTPASGEYRTNTVAPDPAATLERVVPYIVKVETSVDVDPNEAVVEIQRTLDDERGWAGYGRTSFRAVTDEEVAELTVYVASPATTSGLCEPLDVADTWNCRVGDTVVLNSDRWLYMTPTYDDLGLYRSYLVNHEVGHFLGLGHTGCPAEGAPAPVMMQQSIELAGCLPNAWPREAD